MTPGADGGMAGLLESIRRRGIVRAAAGGALWVATVGGILLVVAWLLVGGADAGTATAIPLLLDACAAAAVAGLGWLAGVGWSRRLREPRVAESLEAAVDLPPGSVYGAAELDRETPPGVSPGLAREAVSGIRERVAAGRPAALPGDLGRALRRWLVGGAAAAAIAGLAALALAAASPERARASWSGLVAPVSRLTAPPLPELVVSPGDTAVARGDDLPVRIRAGGRAGVRLRWQEVGEPVRSRDVETPDGEASAVVPGIDAELRYWVEAPDGARSRRFSVSPVDPLFLRGLTLTLAYPRHTGLPVERLEDDFPPLELPEGTSIRIDGRATRAVASARLVPEDGGTPVELAADGAAFRGGWRPRGDGRWRWEIRGEGGEALAAPPDLLEVSVVPDSAPSIAFAFPGRDTVAPLSLRQPLLLDVDDDHGVSRVELVHYRVSSTGRRGERRTAVKELEGARGSSLSAELDLNGEGFLPGDTVRYFARAVDNAPDAHVARTREYALRLPSLSELRWEARDELADAARKAGELAEEAGEVERETRALRRRTGEAGERDDVRRALLGRRAARDSGTMAFEEAEDARRAVEEQRRLLEEADSLAAKVREMERALSEAGLGDPELRRRLDELRSLLEEVATPELRETLRELGRSVDERSPREIREALEEMAGAQEEIRENLERSLELFRRAALEQEFRAASEEARELAVRQEAVAEALEGEGSAADSVARADSAGASTPEPTSEATSGEGVADEGAPAESAGAAARRQEELARRAGELRERLDALGRRTAEMGEEEAGNGVEEAGARTAEARERMEEAARAASGGAPGRAGSRGREAASSMRSASESLRRSGERMTRAWRRSTGEALERAAGDALALARRQAELGKRIPEADARERREIQAEEAAIEGGLRSLGRRVQEASRRSALVGRSVEERLEEARNAVREVTSALERAGGAPSRTAGSRSDGAVEALNSLALSAMGAGEAVGSSGTATGVQEALEQVGRIARQQGDVVQRSSALSALGAGPRTMAEQLRRLARSQAAVARRLGEVGRRGGDRERILGDLEAMAGEAEELARRVEDGRLDPETLERQQRLFHRLLDAGRSLEKDEPSREREARAPGRITPFEAEALGDDAVGRVRFPLPSADVLRELSPAQRQLVVEYFERLNRARSGGSER